MTLLLDLGATHTRLAPLVENERPRAEKRRITSPAALLAFVDEVRARTGATRLVAGLAAALHAGRERAFVTNWGAELAAGDFHALGFDAVLLLNDLECAAWGLVAGLEAGGALPACEALCGGALPSAGPRVLIAPGTGLGSAGLIDLGPQAAPRWRPAPSELQHMEVPAHPELDGPELARCAAVLGHAPTWEDFVSGRGLGLLHALQAGTLAPRAPHLNAEAVIAAAHTGDPHAAAALARYYHLLGRYARVLAAAYMALGGVFIAGATTAANLPWIRRSRLLEAFREPSVLSGGGMQAVPVFLVPGELNLPGAQAVATLPASATGLVFAPKRPLG